MAIYRNGRPYLAEVPGSSLRNGVSKNAILQNVLGPEVTLDITYQNPQETLQGVPTLLPNAEPGVAQISYTVALGDLPTFSVTPASQKYVAMVFGAGRVATAATISWRMKKNGANVNNGTLAVALNYYYNIQVFFFDVAVGDILTLFLWSSQLDSNWDYNAYFINVSRLRFNINNRIYKPINVTSLSAVPILTLGTPIVLATNDLRLYHRDVANGNMNVPTILSSLEMDSTYGLYRIYQGDYINSNSSDNITSVANRPRYAKNYSPTQIKYRELYLDPAVVP